MKQSFDKVLAVDFDNTITNMSISNLLAVEDPSVRELRDIAVHPDTCQGKLQELIPNVSLLRAVFMTLGQHKIKVVLGSQRLIMPDLQYKEMITALTKAGLGSIVDPELREQIMVQQCEYEKSHNSPFLNEDKSPLLQLIAEMYDCGNLTLVDDSEVYKAGAEASGFSFIHASDRAEQVDEMYSDTKHWMLVLAHYNIPFRDILNNLTGLCQGDPEKLSRYTDLLFDQYSKALCSSEQGKANTLGEVQDAALRWVGRLNLLQAEIAGCSNKKSPEKLQNLYQLVRKIAIHSIKSGQLKILEKVTGERLGLACEAASSGLPKDSFFSIADATYIQLTAYLTGLLNSVEVVADLRSQQAQKFAGCSLGFGK